MRQAVETRMAVLLAGRLGEELYGWRDRSYAAPPTDKPTVERITSRRELASLEGRVEAISDEDQARELAWMFAGKDLVAAQFGLVRAATRALLSEAESSLRMGLPNG